MSDSLPALNMIPKSQNMQNKQNEGWEHPKHSQTDEIPSEGIEKTTIEIFFLATTPVHTQIEQGVYAYDQDIALTHPLFQE